MRPCAAANLHTKHTVRLMLDTTGCTTCLPYLLWCWSAGLPHPAHALSNNHALVTPACGLRGLRTAASCWSLLPGRFRAIGAAYLRTQQAVTIMPERHNLAYYMPTISVVVLVCWPSLLSCPARAISNNHAPLPPNSGLRTAASASPILLGRVIACCRDMLPAHTTNSHIPDKTLCIQLYHMPSLRSTNRRAQHAWPC